MDKFAWTCCLVISCVSLAVGCNSSAPDSASASDSGAPVATQPDEQVVAARQLAARAAGTDVAELDRMSGPLWQRPRLASVSEGTADMTAVEQLRTTLQSSDPPAVRAEAARGLGYVKDIDSLPQLLDMMSDDAVVVQEAAHYSVRRILGVIPPSGKDPAEFYRGYAERCLNGKGSRFVEFMKHPELAAESARKASDALKARGIRP